MFQFKNKLFILLLVGAGTLPICNALLKANEMLACLELIDLFFKKYNERPAYTTH